MDGTEIDRQVTDKLVTVARLDLSKTVYNFEFIITNDVGGTGRYKVKVIRDNEDVLVPELQTTIKGDVNTVADGDDVVTVSLYKLPNAQEYDVLTDPDNALVEKVVTGADGKFEFSQDTITAAGVGVYSITVRRAGYLTYYLSEIDVQESYAKAMYDFGRIDMIPGDIVTTGDSHDIIDEKDLEYFKSMLSGTEYTMDEIFGDYADLYPDALADRTVTTDNKDDVKVETPTDDKTDSDTSKDNATVETPTDDKTDSDTSKDETTVETPSGNKTDSDTSKDETTVETPSDNKSDSDTSKSDTTVNTSTDSANTNVSDSSSTDSSASNSDSSSNSYSGDGLRTAVMGVYDEITEDKSEVIETESPVTVEDNTEIVTDGDITIVEDEVIVDDVTEDTTNADDAANVDNANNAVTPSVTPTQPMVDKKICDFNGDGKYNAKDRLYITTHRTIKAPNLNNITGSGRILISAYAE